MRGYKPVENLFGGKGMANYSQKTKKIKIIYEKKHLPVGKKAILCYNLPD